MVWVLVVSCVVPVEDPGTFPDDETEVPLGTVCDRAETLLDQCAGASPTGGPVVGGCEGAQRCVAECAVNASARGGCDALVDDNAAYLTCTAACGTTPR